MVFCRLHIISSQARHQQIPAHALYIDITNVHAQTVCTRRPLHLSEHLGTRLVLTCTYKFAFGGSQACLRHCHLIPGW